LRRSRRERHFDVLWALLSQNTNPQDGKAPIRAEGHAPHEHLGGPKFTIAMHELRQ
jgi:hypothetical protein